MKNCLFFRGKIKFWSNGEEEWKLWLSDDGSYRLCWWRAGIYTAHKPCLSPSLCFGLKVKYDSGNVEDLRDLGLGDVQEQK